MAVLRHPCLEAALCTILAQRFASPEMPAREWRRACEDVLLRPPPGCDQAAAAKATAACSKRKQEKKHGDGGSSGGCSSASASSSKGPSQSSSCENLALAAVARLKATASMESFALMAALAEARANEWPPVEGDWEVSARCRI
jgi:hypothetical protein